MNPIAYLTTPDSLFGWIEWILFIAQMALLLVGAYFAFVHRTTNRIQLQALQRFGYVTLILGALGTLLGLLKLNAVAPFNTRLWLGLIVLFEVAFGIYAVIYSRTTYREQVAAAATTRRSPARPTTNRKAVASNATPNAPQPVEISAPRAAAGRRDARRKRKKR